MNLEELIVRLRQYWHPSSEAVKESFTKHTETVGEIFDALRQDKNLQFLTKEVYPMWTKHYQQPGNIQSATGRSPEEFVAGFYLCNRVIQLMEDVYLDLNLEKEHLHPDNRGWMNYFKYWSQSHMFQVTYKICYETYGVRFGTFYKRILAKYEINEHEAKTRSQRTGG